MRPALVNSHGLRVSVHEPNPATEFELIRERPNTASLPNTDPLIPVHSDLENEPEFYVGNSEWYEVSRVRFGHGTKVGGLAVKPPTYPFCFTYTIALDEQPYFGGFMTIKVGDKLPAGTFGIM